MGEKRPAPGEACGSEETQVAPLTWWEIGVPCAFWAVVVGTMVGSSRGLRDGVVYGALFGVVFALFLRCANDAWLRVRELSRPQKRGGDGEP